MVRVAIKNSKMISKVSFTCYFTARSNPQVTTLTVEINWIRCTLWFIARSRIIENTLKGCLLLFLVPDGGSNLAGPYSNHFPNPAEQS